MSIQLYLSFLAAALVLVYTPGPVNILTMGQSLRTDWRYALSCVWGSTLAVLIQLVVTALCLNSLMSVSEHSLTVLRWAGAGYLVWLGCKQWRSGMLAGPEAGDADGVTRRDLFWRGFATSGLNPKTLLFFPSFFPQFMRADAHWSASRQYLLLASTFALVFVLGMASMALFSHRLRHVLQRPKRARVVNRLMGSLLVGMGAMMAGLR